MRRLILLVAIFLILGAMSAVQANDSEDHGQIEIKVNLDRVDGAELWMTTVKYEGKGTGAYLRVFVPKSLPAPRIVRGDCTTTYNGTIRSIGCPVVDGQARVQFTMHMDRFAVQALGFDWKKTFEMRAEIYESRVGVCYWCRFPKGVLAAAKSVTVSGPASPPTTAVPPTTTAAPVPPTTAAPVPPTTAAPPTTTAAPPSTTAAPVPPSSSVPPSTTAAPVPSTTAAPPSTTAAPVPSTTAAPPPPTTTAAPPPTTAAPPPTTQAPAAVLVEASFDPEHVSFEVAGTATVIVNVVSSSHPLGARLVAIDGDTTCTQRSRYSRGRRYRKAVTCADVSGQVTLTFDLYPLDRASVSVDGIATEL